MDTIRIHQLELDCIVGMLPHERRLEQRVRLDLAFGIDTRKAGRTGKIAETCDYDDIAEEVSALLRFRHYRLIEVATEELCAMLLGNHPVVLQVSVRFDKPRALAGRAQAASVEVTRTRADFSFESQACAEGSQLTLLRTSEAELSILTLEPGRSYQPESGPHRDLHLPIAGELLCQASRLKPFRDAGVEGPRARFVSGPAVGESAQLFRCRAWATSQPNIS